MGMEHQVAFTAGTVPGWEAVRDLLASRSFAVQVRMIDGELAFPDENPPDSWRELRLGTSGGMVTVRRQTDSVTIVTWGNADEGMRQAWNAVAWAWAAVGQGQIATTAGQVSAADFQQAAELPAALGRAP